MRCERVSSGIMETASSVRTQAALRSWLSLDNWHIRHAVTDRHFFVFVASVWADEQNLWDEEQACEVIGALARQLDPGLPEDVLNDALRCRCHQRSQILDFLATPVDEEKFDLLSAG